MITERDTIFALSSGRPPAAIAVIRVSGAHAGAALQALIGRLPTPRHATLVHVCDPGNAEVIDEGLALWFPAPNSETGEDVAELQIHGGRAVIAATLAALGKLPGLRPAEAGEFTRRAFENGRIDLPAVEGLADLVSAETEAQRRQAYQHLKGLLGDRAETWRQRLIEALALVEAGIDFSDEDDVPKAAMAQALALVAPLAEEIGKACAGSGERLREGLRVAIAGPPNAGKSTLFNRLARREAAIVSPFPGTTRDVLELHLDLRGYPVTVLDTAGIRESEDPVEREGVRRATEQALAADLVLWVTDAAEGSWREPRRARDPIEAPPGTAVWVLLNKIDLLPSGERALVSEAGVEAVRLISGATGEGVDELISALTQFCELYFPAEPALVTRERQRAHLQETALALRGVQAAAAEGREEIVAEQLRLATRALGKLLGRVDVEDILDVIFRDFCIGK
ncbi:MAG: tRNA modification GTPase [Alphaproteobacteria bacterium]|jgi:tRNA modification GTPase|nr:tRNA modification GTPase [Alphaproteobacteria bacterium]